MACDEITSIIQLYTICFTPLPSNSTSLNLVYISFPSVIWLTSYQINSIINYQINTIMRLTKKNSPKSYTIYYLPQEIKETMVTEVSYLPITRERLEQFFKDAASKRKPKLVKKRKQSRQQGS